MVNAGTRINLATQARVSFSNLPAGTTTANFELPSGMGELQYKPVDPNTPGTLTLTIPTDNSGAAITTSNSYTLTLTHGMGDIPGFGSLFFQTLGGKTFNINVTAAAQAIVIYFADQIDAE